ncbi:MAG: glycosyltransferase [Eubacteriales bacterium]|nr:glycosyltransferase [Eubacteriales bacterium]
MGEKCLLSISLLMCGRKDSEKCLESLLPFKNKLPCEIIVVDTGCDEDTRKIIEKYADNIIAFKWCNDFSKARNAGLKAAKGEWFLYLDDDEWFEDPKDIIDFFKSGKYKKYNSACYMQRNYHDFEETVYGDAAVSRMIKLEKDTCFMSSIHEYLYPYKGPVMLFDTYVKHF